MFSAIPTLIQPSSSPEATFDSESRNEGMNSEVEAEGFVDEERTVREAKAERVF